MTQPRHHMPAQSANERIRNFDEVALGYTAQIAKEEADRCLNCKNAPCMSGCPVGVHIPDFIANVKQGNIEGAYRVLKKDNNLPAICGRVCPQENQCEKYCVRKDKLGGSVAIGNLERYVADCALAHDFDETPQIRKIGKNRNKNSKLENSMITPYLSFYFTHLFYYIRNASDFNVFFRKSYYIFITKCFSNFLHAVLCSKGLPVEPWHCVPPPACWYRNPFQSKEISL